MPRTRARLDGRRSFARLKSAAHRVRRAVLRESSENFWARYNVTQHHRFSSAEESLAYFLWRSDQYIDYLKLMPVAGLQDSTILDYGCGPGHDLLGFSVYSKPVRLIGVDVSPRSLEQSRARSRGDIRAVSEAGHRRRADRALHSARGSGAPGAIPGRPRVERHYRPGIQHLRRPDDGLAPKFQLPVVSSQQRLLTVEARTEDRQPETGNRRPGIADRRPFPVTPWLAHLYTGLGAAVALAATLAVIRGDYRGAFLWLGVQLVIDGTDGLLARALRVKERLPQFDGARLDDIIDYLTYVFIPVLLMLQANLLPAGWGVWVGALVLLASAYGFSHSAAKIETTDYFFTGFPSYWNLVALYVYLFRLPPAVNAAILVAFAVLVFVPLRYVYPSRTRTLSAATNVLGAIWGLQLTWIVWRLPATDLLFIQLSLLFPVYYLILSFVLDRRSRRRGLAHPNA